MNGIVDKMKESEKQFFTNYAELHTTQHTPADETPPAMEANEYELTEAGNGEMIADKIKGMYKYIPEMKEWYLYDGKVWRVDMENTLIQKAVYINRQARQNAGKIQDTEKSVKRFNWYAGSENQRRLKASIEFAATIPGICARINEFDCDDMLINVQNGTVDLRTGLLLPHDRKNNITKICNIEYDPKAKSDVFDSFLDEIMERNQDNKKYLQKLCGYCCTGKIIEQEFYQCKGSGANGKSVFFETIKYCLGSYVITASPDILMAKDMTSIPNDIARLKGARMVLMSEPDPGRRFSDNAVKSLTGGDTITARFLHREFFEFSMKGKMILLTNHEIKAIGTDHGLWRRMAIIPFKYQVPEKKRDKHLQEKLLANAEAVLAWIVKGCLLWQQEGLEQPQELLIAKEEYRVGQDVIALFIEQCCKVEPETKVNATDLFNAYKQWCLDTGEYDISQREFGKRLREKGYISLKSNVVYWTGICLRWEDGRIREQKRINSYKKPIYSNLKEKGPNQSQSPKDTKEWWEDAEEMEGQK